MTAREMPSCEIEHRVAFYELDPMQIVWHGNYYNYFEDARRALLARYGIDLNDFFQRTQCLFPIIRTASKHILPLRYGDEFICKATLAEATNKLVFDFEIRRKSDGKVCARGRTEQAPVKAPEMELLFGIPAEIRQALGAAMTSGVPDIRAALVSGLEQVTVWSGLLDRINVFPVADGDTGRNLVISLAPLRRTQDAAEQIGDLLLFSARGNAGNIAARFFHGLIQADTVAALPAALHIGCSQAWQAVGDPQVGTILTFFDGLQECVIRKPLIVHEDWVRQTLAHLTRTVLGTTASLPRLREAGVVDAGALGMFVFFHGFFYALIGCVDTFCPVPTLFADRLRVHDAGAHMPESGYCVDMVLEDGGNLGNGAMSEIAADVGESLVVIRSGSKLKVHLHTSDRAQSRHALERFGTVLDWSEDDLREQTAGWNTAAETSSIHIMTDAAGSLTRAEARRLGITLLDSYVVMGHNAWPESCVAPETVYHAMRQGQAVSTSQASIHERHQSYQGACSLYDRVLYLAVGAVFTGNHAAAQSWKASEEAGDGMTVFDTGCASGRLGLMAALAAEEARKAANTEEVIAFVRNAADRIQEYIFVDTLKYLAAGGRLSKTTAFFGDLLHRKPIVSPHADGARKIGVVKNREDQVAFARRQLETIKTHAGAVIWLEYTDNADWLHDEVSPLIAADHPNAEIVIKPISLTTGVHVGPGAWGLAFFA